MNNFVVAISGAQNTGKSTIVKTLIERYPDLFWTPERTYRDVVRERGLVINQQGSFESQKLIMEFLIDQLFDVSKVKSKIVLLDRSILDCHVYSKYLFYNKKITLDEFKQLESSYNQVSYYLADITNIFIRYNPNINLVEDKLRDTDIDYIKVIDYIFEEEFGKFQTEQEIDNFYSTIESRIIVIVNVILYSKIRNLIGYENAKVFYNEEV
jgi:deoxyadenosine/deoxycytidine kinase